MYTYGSGQTNSSSSLVHLERFIEHSLNGIIVNFSIHTYWHLVRFKVKKKIMSYLSVGILYDKRLNSSIDKNVVYEMFTHIFVFVVTFQSKYLL